MERGQACRRVVESPIGAVAYDSQRELPPAHRGWGAIESGVPTVEVMLEAETISWLVDGAFDYFVGISDFDPYPTRRGVVTAAQECEGWRVLEGCEPGFASPIHVVRRPGIVKAKTEYTRSPTTRPSSETSSASQGSAGKDLMG